MRAMMDQVKNLPIMVWRGAIENADLVPSV
jgi:hypothetical protein